MQTFLDQNYIADLVINRTRGAFGKKIGLYARGFGCWHKQLTRPFTNRSASYRACLNCGARKKFDAENLRTFGPFYYPPAVTFNDH